MEKELKYQIRHLIRPVLIILIAGCSTRPQEIYYGHDGCQFCQMGIVDQRYGAELVTDKGKTYKFDAIECMVHFMERGEGVKYAHIIVNTFDRPSEFTAVQDANFLVSTKLPSPMGMYLTAFTEDIKAIQAQDAYPGKLYSWDELLHNFENIKTELNAGQDINN